MHGGHVDYKDVKESTVTTSTTEADSPALSEPVNSLHWGRRFMQHIDFAPGHHLPIRYSNKQAVDLVSSRDFQARGKFAPARYQRPMDLAKGRLLTSAISMTRRDIRVRVGLSLQCSESFRVWGYRWLSYRIIMSRWPWRKACHSRQGHCPNT